MGLHVDVSNLSEEECSQIVCVIAKDVALRKFDQERVRKLRKDFDELRRSITLKSSKRRSLDDNCQICGRILFRYCCLFSIGQRCLACEHMACSKCRNTLMDDTDEKQYLCFLCAKKRQLKRHCFDWFYEAVELRFKRFGSAKVLRGIYRGQKGDSRVMSLLAMTREMALSTTIYTSARRSSSLKMQPGYSGFHGSSTAGSSLSESERAEKKLVFRSKSTDDLGLRRSNNFEIEKPRQRSRKISAPASFWVGKISQEPESKSLETMEEKSRGSSDNSEFEVLSDPQDELLSSESMERETSFTFRILGEVEVLALASVALMLAIFLSVLACIGYIDVFQTDSEEEDGKEN